MPMRKRFGCLVLALGMLLFCGCSLIRQSRETAAAKQAEADELLEQLMTCLQNNDVMGAAALAYDPVWMQRDFSSIRDYWPVKSTDVYEPCGLNYNINISNTEQNHSEVRAVYLVKSNAEDYQVVLVTRKDATAEGIVSFNVVRVQELIDAGIEPETSKFPVAKKSFGQWCFTVFWILACLFCIATIIDIVRKKPKLWGLWILGALLFIGFYLNKGPNSVHTGLRFGLFNSSEWTRFLDGTNHYQLCIPIGAILYWIRRRQLLKKKSAPAYAVPAASVSAQSVPAPPQDPEQSE